MRRTLLAVLAADVVGYSRLMSDDAEVTLATLRRLRTEIFGPAVAAKRGRVIKSMGDGWIVVFNAISDAVECAMQVQDRLKTDGAMALRIGVHLGDVVEVDEDVFGDGVNIAARLQALADPGALTISGAARALLDGTLKPSFDFAGERALKNIEETVAVWVRGGGVAGAKAALETPGLPRIALVPVATQDQSAEVRDLASALTGDLANFLNSIRYISGRTTEAPDADAYVLRAMLRARGDRVRLEAWLEDPDGRQIQSEKYDGNLGDVFDWQDATALSLAKSILDRITIYHAGTSEALSPEDCSAEQLLIRALSRPLLDGPSYRHFAEMLSLAITKKPDWGYPYALASVAVPTAPALGLASHVADYAANVPDWAKRAEDLEPEFSPVRIFLTFGHLLRTGDRELTRRQIRTVVRNLPFDPEAILMAAWVHNFIDEPAEALKYIEQAENTVMPLFLAQSVINARTMAHVLLGEFENAIFHANQTLEIAPDYPPPWRFLASSYGNLGDLDAAKTALTRLLEVSDGETISGIRERAGYGSAESPGLDRYMDGLRKAGVPE